MTGTQFNSCLSPSSTPPHAYVYSLDFLLQRRHHAVLTRPTRRAIFALRLWQPQPGRRSIHTIKSLTAPPNYLLLALRQLMHSMKVIAASMNIVKAAQHILHASLPPSGLTLPPVPPPPNFTAQKAKPPDPRRLSGLQCALMTVRSVRKKAPYVAEFIIANELHLLFLTETWLGNDDTDVAILSDSCPTQYQHFTVPRNGQ